MIDDPGIRSTAESYEPGPWQLVAAEQEASRLLRKKGVRVEAERDEYRQAALELNAEIRYGLAWVATGAEPSVALHHMLKIADKWRALLEDAPNTLDEEGEA